MALSAFWGPQTANIKFDYSITRYIAEFINSLTNLVYVIYAIYGLRQLHQDRKPTTDDSISRAVPYWGLLAVGYETQMLDDLSMLFTTTPILHRVLTVNTKHRVSHVTAILLASLLALITVYHVATDELLIHNLFFGTSITVIGVRTMQLINTRTRAGSPVRAQAWGMVTFGALIFHGGYWLWLVDHWACGFLGNLRDRVDLPWAFVPELHGWWHICTGIGSYVYIAVVDHLLSCPEQDLNKTDAWSSFAWPAPWASQSIFAGMTSSTTAGRKYGRQE
ncbi:ceramidase [Aspergillus karnatakaensis]|uniref:ceramidase n=1 Tax=Aspergillus karnatakaensis TaxID=1810916 RepID=UPI003CCDDCFF